MFKTAIKERTFAQRRDSTLCGELPIPYIRDFMNAGRLVVRAEKTPKTFEETPTSPE